MTLKELMEKRQALADELTAIHESAEKEDRSLSDDEKTRWDEAEGEIKALDERIERAKRAEELAKRKALDTSTDGEGDPGQENRTSRPAAEPVDRAALDRMRGVAMRGWLSYQADREVSDTQRNACERFGLNYANPEIRLSLRKEERVQTTDIPSGGGFLTSAEMVGQFDKALQAFGGLMNQGDVMRTSDGNDLLWPGADDTGNTGALLAEASASGASAQDVAFTQQIWHSHQYTSNLIRVSRKLIRDSGVNLEGILMEMLGERLGRILAQHFATGTGSGQAEGIESGSVLGVTAASATALAADELEDLIASVDPAYRVGPSVGFLMHDSIRSEIGKLKDGNGQYLFRAPGDGPVSRIFGFPVFVDQDLDSAFASGAQSVFFGDLSKYKIRMQDEITLRLEERYGEFNQVAFVSFLEADGKVLNSGGDPIKHIVH